LSRSSDLIGNTDSKTFTFSAWVYPIWERIYVYRSYKTANTYFMIEADWSFSLNIGQWNWNVWTVTAITKDSSIRLPLNSWNHILVSIDLSNISKRKVYINNNFINISNEKWVVYNNESGGFLADRIMINAANLNWDQVWKGILSNIYLDYTYRDLSQESERRKFITAEWKPAQNQESMNPIIYLPLSSAETAGTNLGTWWDFTVNGTLDTATVGANDWSSSASKFDWSNDYLLKQISSPDSTIFTMSLNYRIDTVDGTFRALLWGTSWSAVTFMTLPDGNAYLDIFSNTPTGSITRTSDGSANFLMEKWINHHLAISLDSTNINTRKLFHNWIDVTNRITWEYFNTNLTTKWTNMFQYIGEQDGSSRYHNWLIWELRLDQTYYDLSTNNPFWESETNKPKPVRQVIAETGNTPLIAMPISADNPGKNYWTWWDFTLNWWGLTWARWGSEYWARSATVSWTSDSDYITWNLSNATNTKTISLVYPFQYYEWWAWWEWQDEHRSKLLIEPSQFDLEFEKETWWNIFRQIYKFNNNLVVWNWYILMCSFDLSNTSKRYCKIINQTWTDNYAIYTNELIWLNKITNAKTLNTNGNATRKQSMWPFYFSTDYIDFSQESNRNKFIDQLGYPKNLSKAIDSGEIPTPLIYMPFDDPNNLGKNLWTWWDFTVNWNVTQWSDVDPGN